MSQPSPLSHPRNTPLPLFQQPARTAEEVAAGQPLAITPDEVLSYDEAEWYARAYRPDAPQLTLRAVLTGSVLGFFLSFTNVYIGLKTGWFLGVNLTACILSYAVSTSLHKAGAWKSPMSILETNCAVSTASSAGYATGTMVVAAFPAMLLLSVTDANPAGTQQSWTVVALWIFFLGALGVTLAIPMKRSMINRDKLRFPSGTAAAVTLHGLYSRGGEAPRKARALFLTAGVSAVVPLLKDLDIRKVGVDPQTGAVVRGALVPGASNVFDWVGRAWPSLTERMATAGPPSIHPGGRPFALSDYQVKLDHGPALLFAGTLIGLRITAWMMIGGLVLVALVAPPALDGQWQSAAHDVARAATAPGTAWREIGIWVGAPLLVASGLVSLAAQWRTMVRALAGMLPRKGGASAIDEDIEVPARWFAAGMVGSGLGIVLLAWRYFEIPLHYGVLAIAMTFVLAIVACRTTGESDITPGGALGQVMQLTYGMLIPQNVTANLQTAAISSGASHSAADLLNDLKSGYLLGANPRRQFLAQAMGVATGTIASTLAYFILVPSATALSGTATHPPAFPAVAAQQWKAVAEVFKLGIGNLHPMSQHAIGWGAAIGGLLALAEVLVPKAHRRWIPSPTGLGLGFMLPFFYPLAMFVGAAAAAVATAANKRWAERYLVPIAAGGIAGESIVGVMVQALNNVFLH
jgi:uncharacterized oligopeptide transporter (OPT) family protein